MTFATFQQKFLFHNGGNHLGMPDLVEPDLFAGSDTQVQNAPVHVWPAVIHTHDYAAAVIDAYHLELCPEGQALVRTRIVILVENLATRSLLAMESGPVVACLALNLEAYFSLLARGILFFREPHVALARSNLRVTGGTTRKQDRKANHQAKQGAHVNPYSKSYMLLYVFSRTSSSLLLTSACFSSGFFASDS